MSYNKFLEDESIQDRLWNDSHFKNKYVINKILEYKEFDEDDYSEDSKP